jgi:hypothetical protein
MSCPLISLFAFVALSIAAFGLGRPLLRWIGVADDDGLATVAFSIGLGLIVAGVVLLLLGIAGVLYLPVVGMLTMLCCCWGLVEIGIVWLRSKEPVPDDFHRPGDPWEPTGERPWSVPSRWLLAAGLTAATIICVASLLNALAPPTTTVTLSCQLESAKRCLVEHRIAALPVADPARPLLVDMWYLWALVFDSGVCAQLVHWGFGILLVLATVTLATPLLGRPWAWMAGGLVVLTPAINQQMSLPAESVALAALGTLALAAWSQAAVHGASRRWFIAAGLTAGGALGVHYAAALLLLAVAGGWAWMALRRVERCRLLLRAGTTVVVGAVGAGALWRLLLIWPAAKSACLASAHAMPATLPDHLGLALLAAAPGVLLVRRLRGLGPVLSVALVYAALAFSLSGDARLLFSAVPPLSVAAVWMWLEMRRFPPAARWVGAAALAVTIACGMAVSLVRSPDALAVALGLEDREEYLLRSEPTYVAATIANHVLRTNARLLSQERQAFYFDCPVTWENSLGRAIDGEPFALSVHETVQRLRRAGFTHLLLAETAANGPQTAVSPLHRVADATPTLTDYCFRTADGRVRHYRLVMLR